MANARQNPAVTLSIRIEPDMRDRLTHLAEATGRTKSFLAAEAVRQYLEHEAWQIEAIKQAVERSESKDAKFVDHEKIVEWLNTWGTDDEMEPPECE